MENASEGIVLRTPADLVKAMNAMLLQMNRPQRKGFLKWVKEKRRQYDFQFPEGYKPPKEEPKNETIISEPRIIVDASGSPIVSVPVTGNSSPTSPVTDSPVVESNADGATAS
jgi:hypothetical protein